MGRRDRKTECAVIWRHQGRAGVPHHPYALSWLGPTVSSRTRGIFWSATAATSIA